VRRIVIIIVLIVLVLLVGYWVWNHNHGSNVFGDGAITEHDTNTSNDQSAMNSGSTTDLDGNTAHPTTSRSDEPGTINTVPVGSTGSQSASGSTPMGTPTAGNAPPPSPSPISAPGGLTTRSNQPVLGPGGPLPAGDTVAPNPPNHVAFGGTGKYMWYRQGDLTWRVNSDTGASCIAFDTMQQWARPIVYQNGCDSRRG
jgi:hypothetical protein